MPPKKAKAPPPGFKGVVLDFAETAFPPGTMRGRKYGDIQPVVKQLGGKISRGVTASTTHLVCTNDQYKNPNTKVHRAIAEPNIRIVTFEWLEDSLHFQKPLEDLKYVLHDRGYATSSTPATTSTTIVTIDQTKPATGKKRGRAAAKPDVDADGDEDEPDAKATKRAKSESVPKKETESNGQIAKSSSMIIPLDDGAPSNYKVFISDDGMIYDAALNQTNAGQNNNKFYRIQVLKDPSGQFYCWTRWGRVGERGQSKLMSAPGFDEAFKDFNKKFKDKNGNRWEERFGPTKAGKYTFVEKNYEDSDDEDKEDGKNPKTAKTGKADTEEVKEEEVESKLPEAVQNLMGLIFNQEYFQQTFAALNYDAKKMPLGKLSKRTLLRGYDVLKELANFVASPTPTGSIPDKSNEYFSLIPHDFGRGRPPVLYNMDAIKREIELLDTLSDMSLANDIIKDAKKNKEHEKLHLFDRQYAGLGMQEMTPLGPKTTEYKELQIYLEKSVGQTHSIVPKLTDIFRIERQGEYDRFSKSPYAKYPNSDRRLLWHGSRCTNFGGILSQGLRIAPPEAPVSGYMFGKGVYLADMSTKSANYCCAYNSGNTDYNAGGRAKDQGSISTWGVGSTAPQGWKDAGCVNKALKGVLMPDTKSKPPGPTNEPGAGLAYNEYIVYDVAQIKLRYLLRFKI